MSILTVVGRKLINYCNFAYQVLLPYTLWNKCMLMQLKVDELHDGSTRGGKVKIIYEDWIPKVDNNNKESTPNMPTQQ